MSHDEHMAARELKRNARHQRDSRGRDSLPRQAATEAELAAGADGDDGAASVTLIRTSRRSQATAASAREVRAGGRGAVSPHILLGVMRGDLIACGQPHTVMPGDVLECPVEIFVSEGWLMMNGWRTTPLPVQSSPPLL